MGFWKEFFSNLDEPAIIISTTRTIEIPDRELLQHKKIIKQRINKEYNQVEYVDADYKLLE